MLKSLGEKLINKDITTGFKIDLQVKNLKIAMDSDYIKKIPIFGMRLVALLYAEKQAHNECSYGNQSLFREYNKFLNISERK